MKPTELATLPAATLALVRAQDARSVSEKYDASLSANTKKTYQDRWAAFATWCRSRELDETEASPQTVAEFLSSLADDDKTWNTIKLTLAAINKRYALYQQQSPGKSIEVATAMQGIARTIGTRPRGMDGLTPANIAQMLNAVDDSDRAGAEIRKVRNRAILLLGYISAMRVSNIVALTRGDVQFIDAGGVLAVKLLLRRSKTDQTGRGKEIVLRSQANAAHCPVVALHAWVDLDCAVDYRAPAPDDDSGLPLFCATGFLQCRDDVGDQIPRNTCSGCAACVDGDGSIISVPCAILDQPMHHDTIRKIIKALALLANIDGRFGPHSLRRGSITAMAVNGMRVDQIQAISGHKTYESVQTYIAPVDALRDNATDGLMDLGDK